MMFSIKLCVVASLILSVSCHAETRAINPRVLDVFRDFTLVGQGPATFENDGSLDVTYIVPHDESEKVRPAQLQAKVQYVFHYREGRADNERLGREQLPTRLKELGFEVLEAPNYKGGQFSRPYIGGPYFAITFQDGEHKGVIFNRVDGNVRDENQIVEDYVLVFVS